MPLDPSICLLRSLPVEYTEIARVFAESATAFLAQQDKEK